MCFPALKAAFPEISICSVGSEHISLDVILALKLLEASAILSNLCPNF